MLLMGPLGDAAAGAGAAGAGAAAEAGAGATAGAAGAGAAGAGAGGGVLGAADADWTGCSLGDVPFRFLVALSGAVAPVSATLATGRVFECVVRGALPSGIAVLKGDVLAVGSAVAGAAATAVPSV